MVKEIQRSAKTSFHTKTLKTLSRNGVCDYIIYWHLECLPHKDKDGIHDECAFGIATDDGVHYAIDLQDVPEYEHQYGISHTGIWNICSIRRIISSTRWSTYDIKGYCAFHHLETLIRLTCMLQTNLKEFVNFIREKGVLRTRSRYYHGWCCNQARQLHC